MEEFKKKPLDESERFKPFWEKEDGPRVVGDWEDPINYFLRLISMYIVMGLVVALLQWLLG